MVTLSKYQIPLKRFDGKEPSVAYTDFESIYVSNCLHGKEFDLAERHECAHIWLEHKSRFQKLKSEDKGFNYKLANIAGDYEIAKHLYSEEDNLIINAPRSLLKGGVTTSDCDQYPNCSTMEEFYEELKKENIDQFSTFDIIIDKIEEVLKELDLYVKQIIENAIALNEEKIEETKRLRSISIVQESINNFRPPKPTLVSEIDSVFGKSRVVREKSYRRPDRREHNDFIFKGRISKPKNPRLNVFVDRSGSFCPSKTNTATKTLKAILSKYRGRLDNDVYYFNHNLMIKDPGVGDGGTNYYAVTEKIIEDNADLSIIVTDDDIYNGEHVKLPKTIVIRVGCQKTSIAETLRLPEFPDSL